MEPTAPIAAEHSAARTALLDAAKNLMLTEGYAAVTSRRVAAEAQVNPGLVYYYFGPMDNLFVEVFREQASRMLDQQTHALASEQPLWAIWDSIRDGTNTALNLEFLALGNHRQVVREEVKAFSLRFRRLQFDGLSKVLKNHGVDTRQWPAEAVMLIMDGVARFLLEETAYGLNLGHAKAVSVVERLIAEMEGPRKTRRRKSK